MYIMINDVIGEKMIYLAYPIRSSKEVAVISMFSDNIKYEMAESFKLKLINDSEKQVLNRTYTHRELDVIVEREPILTNLDNDLQIVKTDKLAKITEMIFNLDELDNSDNLKDGRPSNTLFMCLALEILRVTNQECTNIRNLRMARLLL